MSFVDKMRAYLNEEESPEQTAQDTRVHLQAAGESETAPPKKNKTEHTKNSAGNSNAKKSPRNSAENSNTNNQSSASASQQNKRNIQFVDATASKSGAKPEKRSGAATGKNHDNASDNQSGSIKNNEKPRFNSSQRVKQDANVGKADNIDKDTKKENKTDKKSKKSKVKKSKKRLRNEKKLEQELRKKRGLELNTVPKEDINPEDAEKQAVEDFCEQLVDVSYHMEDMKREYKLVSEYLMDIQRIDELPIEYANEIISIGQRIERLDNNRQMYLKSENLLSEEQFSLLAQLEEEVPGTIRNLYDMEMRDSMLKNDMGHLEGEKEDLKFFHEEYSDSVGRIKGVLATVLVLCMVTLGVIASVAFVTKSSVTVYALSVGALVAVIFAIGYVRYVNIRNDSRQNDARLARAVSLLNKVKVKYINNVNALDYVYEKYGVNSSSELQYVWDRYNTMVRDMLRFSETNKDLRVSYEELTAKLKSFGLTQPEVWKTQIHALVDRREMVEVRHALNVRRQKLRESIAICEKIRDNATTALRAIVAENPGMMELVQEILNSYHLSIL